MSSLPGSYSASVMPLQCMHVTLLMSIPEMMNLTMKARQRHAAARSSVEWLFGSFAMPVDVG